MYNIPVFPFFCNKHTSLNTNQHVVFRYTAEVSHGCKATNRRVQDTKEPRQSLCFLSFEYFCQAVVSECRHYDLLFTSVPAFGNRHKSGGVKTGL